MEMRTNRKIMLSTFIILILAAASLAMLGTSESRDGENDGTVFGTVYDAETKEAMADVLVIIYETGMDYYYEQNTDGNGSYRFEDLPRVEYDILVYLDGFYTYEEQIDLISLESVQHDIYLEPYECKVFGHVYDYNTWKSIDDDVYVLLEGYDENNDWYSYRTFIDNEGYYEVYSPPGEYSFKAGGDLYHEHSDRITLADGDELQEDIYLVPFCYITGFIYDVETDEPVEGAEVRLNRQYSGGAYVHLKTIYTNETGEYFFAVETGIYIIEVHKPGYKSDRHEYVVLEEGVSMAYDFYLEIDYGVLFGYAYDEETGEALEGVNVEVFNWDSWERYSVYTDENGYYELYPGPGDVNVNAYLESYKPYYEMVTMEEDVPRQLDIFLEPYESTIFGKVTDGSTSEPIEGVYVSLDGNDDYLTTYTDENGTYRLYMDGGEYRFSISEEGYDTYEDTIEVESGEEIELDVTLAPYTTRVFGYVTDGDGDPIEYAYVRIESEEYYYDYNYVDDDGYYEFVVPPSEDQGEYTLSYAADGYQESQETVWLDEGEQLQIDVTLEETWSPGSIWRWIWEIIFG